MGAASLIASAFGIILLILAAYFLAAGAVSTMEVVSSAQKDMTQLQVEMLGTSIDILEKPNATQNPIRVLIENNGREPIRDYSHMDIYLEFETDCSKIPYYEGVGGDYWYSDTLSQWDPGEVRNLTVYYSGGTPKAVQIVTANGITARTITS